MIFRTVFKTVVVLIVVAGAAQAQTVRVTPLGSRTGEFCSGDRALLFERSNRCPKSL